MGTMGTGTQCAALAFCQASSRCRARAQRGRPGRPTPTHIQNLVQVDELFKEGVLLHEELVLKEVCVPDLERKCRVGIKIHVVSKQIEPLYNMCPPLQERPELPSRLPISSALERQPA